jgi:hypothetical protein
MRRRDVIAGAAAAIISRQAHGARGGSGTTLQSFSTITLDNFTFVPDGISAQDVGNVVVTMNPTSPASTATISLGGTDAAKFQLTNSGVLPCKVQAKSTTGTGADAITLTGTQGSTANSPYTTSPITLTGVASGAGPSITFANTSGSASPSPTPMQTGQAFVRGVVPSLSVAVPTVSGTPLATWQADNQTYWDDGSLRFAVFRFLLASVAGNGTVQVVFVPTVGTWPTTSTVTTADVTSETDHKIAITNCHTAQVGAAGSVGIAKEQVLSLTMAGGLITGGTVWFPANMTAGTTNVSGGGGTGAQVSVSSGTITVVNPGSGYGLLGGTGAFNASFNTGIATNTSAGNHVGTSLVQYAKGPACDAWRLRMPISGMNHAHVTFYIARWKTAGGTLLTYKRSAVIGNGLVDATKTIPNYTYDLDWKDGSTVIRGTTNSSAGFTNLMQFAFSSFGTFDSAGLADWSVNDAAYKAVVQQRTAIECDQFKDAGLAIPWLPVVPTTTVPTTPAAYENNTQGGLDFLCNYQPLGSAGVRSPLGSASLGNQVAPMSGVNALHWTSERAGLAGATTWLRNSRVGAANSLGSAQLGAGVFDPTTFYVPNCVPAATQAFSGMTPTLEAKYMTDIPFAGYINTMIDNGGGTPGPVIGNPYHQVCLTYYPYLLEGEQWVLDAMMAASTVVLYAISWNYHRQATLGSTTYYGINVSNVGNVRVESWLVRTQGYTLAMMPTAWADGVTNIERNYISYVLKNQHDYLNALVPFTGNVKLGAGGAVVSKTTDFTGTGLWPESFSTYASAGEITVPYMDGYVMAHAAHLAFLHQGTAVGTSLATWRDYFKNYNVKLWAYAGAHYLNDAYRINALTQRPPPTTPSDTTWASEGNVSTPALAIFPQSIGSGNTPVMTFTSGSATVALNFPIKFFSTTRCASGSRVKLTVTNLDSYGNTGKAAPGGFDFTTWYYWKELTSTTGQLCSDAGLTTPVTPSTSVSGLYFWIVPSNTLPLDSSGSGTYNGGQNIGTSRIAIQMAIMRLCQAMGMADDANGNVTDAITNCAAIFNSIPGQTGFVADPTWAIDNVL